MPTKQPRAVQPYREVSRLQGDIEVAESGMYAVGNTPANESFITVSVVKEVLLVNYATGNAIRLEFTTPDMLKVSPSPPDATTGVRPAMTITYSQYDPLLVDTPANASPQSEHDALNAMLDFSINKESATNT